MTCAAHLKQEAGEEPAAKAGNASMDKDVANLHQKVTAYCTANPAASAVDAATAAIGG